MNDRGRAPVVHGEGSQNMECYRCHQVGHFANKCPVQNLHIGEIGEEEEPEAAEECGEEVYEAELDLAEEYEGNEEEIESPNLVGVVRYILAQTRKNEDWRRTNILQTFIKLGDKVCKIIVDSGSCINAISTNAVKSLGLPTAPHPNPYKVSWIDATSIPIKSICQVTIYFQSYQEKVWCDVLPLGVSNIILGRPWLYDHDVTLFGRSNSCSFNYQGKRIVINSTPPKENIKRGSNNLKEEKPGLNLITAKEMETKIIGSAPLGVLVVKEIHEQPKPEHPKEVVELLKDFQDVFPEDLPLEHPLGNF